MNDVKTIRPIARQARLLTERGRMLILRRRRQNERGEQRAALWNHFKDAVGDAVVNSMQFSALPQVFRTGMFTPVPKKARVACSLCGAKRGARHNVGCVKLQAEAEAKRAADKRAAA